MPALATNIPVAVIGAGTMGAGIAQVAAMAGHKVFLYDTRADAAQGAIDGIASVLNRLVDKNILQPAQAKAGIDNLQAASGLADLAECGLIVEAIVERLDIKISLFQELEAIVGTSCILATNTSSIPVTAIGAGLQHPERLGGLHFFNPAPRMPLVEVISGLDTSSQVAQTLYDTAAAWGKTPVMARSTPGFIVNRVARPFYAEGLRLLLEQATEPATLDHIMRTAGGFRMGPCELTDLIGHDVNAAVTRTVWESFYNSLSFEPSLVQQELVDAGKFGRKSGRGFYDYRAGASTPEPNLAKAAGCPDNITIFGDSTLAKALMQRLDAAEIAYLNDNAADGRIAQANTAVIYQTDGRSATELAHANDLAATLTIDLALDYNSATCLPLAKAAQCPQQALTDATGFLQAAGFAVAIIKDIPGMAVMRTVAMLINEAADTVNQGVCNAKDVDLAMRLGVNYPLGPLEWSNRIGIKKIFTVLSNMRCSDGERYRPCTAIQTAIYSGNEINAT